VLVSKFFLAASRTGIALLVASACVQLAMAGPERSGSPVFAAGDDAGDSQMTLADWNARFEIAERSKPRVAVVRSYSHTHAPSDTGELPVVYLTFDDGPSADHVTRSVLDILARYGAKATFFVTGKRTQASPGQIGEILNGGHAIGNHTHAHAPLTRVSDERVLDELNRAGNAVRRAGGPTLTCFRPPFGLTNDRVNHLAGTLGLMPVKWSVDTRDWAGSTTEDEIYQQLMRSRNGSIVLLHDGPNRRQRSLAVFARWMGENAHRYQFKTLPACDSYGGGIFLADWQPEQHAADLAAVQEPQTIQSLLNKLRSYDFALQQALAPAITVQVAATLDPNLISR